MQKEDLHDIFDMIRNNDDTAIEKLYKEYSNLIYGIAFSLVKDKENSEDIVQNVYLKIVKMDKELLPTKFEMSWLYTVTKNETINYIKKQKKETNIEDIYEISTEDEELDNIVDRQSYNKIINNLCEKDKEIVSLKILGDRKFKEISELLKMPIGTVQWRYYKSLHTIKILIGNIAMFVVTFAIYLSYNMKKSQSMFEDNKQSEAGGKMEEELDSTNTANSRLEKDEELQKGEEIQKNEDAINQATFDTQNQETTITDSVTIIEKGVDYANIGLLSLTGIFLFISIIIGIRCLKNKKKK